MVEVLIGWTRDIFFSGFMLQALGAPPKTERIYRPSDFEFVRFSRDESVGSTHGAVGLQTERHLTPLSPRFRAPGRRHAAQHGAVRGQEAEEAGPESVSWTPQAHRKSRRAPVLSRSATADEATLAVLFIVHNPRICDLNLENSYYSVVSSPRCWRRSYWVLIG